LNHFLLDSHILLWYADGDARLPKSITDRIRKAERLVFSAASVWELSIKISLGKLPRREFRRLARTAGCDLLDVTPQHAEEILTLPRHHRDPFDHLLLAQAKVEGLTLVTHDDILVRYGVPVLLV
jgi:PIN domain nuclease of toxin-antitoxin system